MTAAEAEVYAATIRSLVPAEAPDEPVSTTVFVGDGTDDGLGLELQAGILESLDDYESVRFVDGREEAVDEEAPAAPVRSDGVYVEFEAIDVDDGTATVRVLRYRDADDEEQAALVLERTGSTWSVVDREHRP